MNPIYYDGTKYYKVGKHKDGSYVKFEVDNVGTYKCGGKVHKYGGHLDMNMDVSKMYQVGGQVKDVELDMVKETGPSWNHYNRFASPMSQINYANGLQNQIAIPGVGVVQNDTVIPDYQEFTTNNPRYAVTEKLPRNSKFHFKNIETAEKLINAYDKEASKHIHDKDQTLRNDYLNKIKDVDEYIEDQFKNRKQNGGLLKAQTGLTIPKKYKLAGANVDFNPNEYVGEIVPHDTRWDESLAERDVRIAMDPTYDYGFKKLPTNFGNFGINNLNGKSNTGNSSLMNNTNPVTNITSNTASDINTNVNPTSLGTSNHQAFNPRKLTTYGDRISENALNRTTGYNLARSLEPAYKNPLIIPEFKFKKQFAQADFNPVYEMQNVGMRNIGNNARSTAALMGNLQQLNANMVKSKSDIARQAQTQQRGYDATYNAQQQAYENQKAVARQNVENLNKGDEAEKFNFLSDTMTNWEKADQGRAKLYNANLADWNKLNTYVNSLSNEYTAVRDPKEGTVKIVFKSNGKEVPNEELEKKKAEYAARQNANQTGTTPVGSRPVITNSSPAPGGRNYKIGGKVTTTNTPNKIKKLRTGLY